MSDLPAEFWFRLAAAAAGLFLGGFVGAAIPSFLAARRRRRERMQAAPK